MTCWWKKKYVAQIIDAKKKVSDLHNQLFQTNCGFEWI